MYLLATKLCFEMHFFIPFEPSMRSNCGLPLGIKTPVCVFLDELIPQFVKIIDYWKVEFSRLFFPLILNVLLAFPTLSKCV